MEVFNLPTPTPEDAEKLGSRADLAYFMSRYECVGFPIVSGCEPGRQFCLVVEVHGMEWNGMFSRSYKFSQTFHSCLVSVSKPASCLLSVPTLATPPHHDHDHDRISNCPDRLQESCARVEELLSRGQEAAMKLHKLDSIDLMVRTLKTYCSAY